MEAVLREALILIVDDDRFECDLLKRLLAKSGFQRLESASNGRVGLAQVEQLKPDLIVTDVIMPEMDGEQLCRAVRAHADPRIAQIPILVQTVLDDAQDQGRLFAAGATDFVSKPVDFRELVARTRVHLERELSQRALREFKLRVAQELELARDTQRLLNPSPETMLELGAKLGFEIDGYHLPSSELGGDLWGIREQAGKLAVHMVDFSGHGINAALNVFRMHTLIHHVSAPEFDTGRYLTQLNRLLTPLLPVGDFATMVYVVVDPLRECLAYSSAAAPAVLSFDARGECQGMLESRGLPLGVAVDAVYDTCVVPFGAGSTLFFASDALLETNGPDRSFLPVAELQRLLGDSLRAEGASAASVLGSLLKHLRADYLPNLVDDLTLGVCRLRPR